MLPMATAHFQSTGASFKPAILCHPEPLEIHSLMPLCYHFGAFFKASLLAGKAAGHAAQLGGGGGACPLYLMGAGPSALQCCFPEGSC